MTDANKSKKPLFILVGIIILAIVIFLSVGEKKPATDDAASATAESGTMNAAESAAEATTEAVGNAAEATVDAAESAAEAVSDAVTPSPAPAAESAPAPAQESAPAQAPAQGQ